MDKALMINRRHLIAGTSALGLSWAPAEAASVTRELRRLRPLIDAAVSAELESEKTPAYAAACARAEQLEDRFNELARQAWGRTGVGWDDFALRTEIAAQYSEYDASGLLHGLDLSNSDRWAQARAHLLWTCAHLTGARLGDGGTILNDRESVIERHRLLAVSPLARADLSLPRSLARQHLVRQDHPIFHSRGYCMRGEKRAWAQIGALRVKDGDDVVLRDAEGREWSFRLDGYDAPETHNFRSRHDRGLEEKRGLKAMLRLTVLIREARSVYILPGAQQLPGRGVRFPAVLLINGRDVAQIAIQEGWGVRVYRDEKGVIRGRQENDWGDHRKTFPDHLPLPEGFSEEDDDP